jgi:hypothetical protein
MEGNMGGYSTIDTRNPAGYIPVSGSEGQTPLLDNLSEAVKQANQMVDQATKQVQNTPMYSSSTSATPTMPVPSVKAGLFSGASVHNLDSQKPVTRAGARNKAVGQIAAQAGGFVGAWVKKKEAEKTQALAQDLNRTLELQKGIDEAKQVMQQDPNNAQAKATLQKNQALLGALLNGKNGKEIAKAYDVTYGPGAADAKANDKDKIHKQAMTDAMRQHQQDEKLEQFEGQQPSSMSPNPIYDAAMKNLQTVQAAAQKANTTFATLYGKLATDDAANKRAAATDASRERMGAAADASREAVEKDRRAAEKYTADAHIQAVRELRNMADKSAAQKIAAGEINTYQVSIEKNNTLITGIDQKLNTPKVKQAPDSDGEKTALRQEKAYLQNANKVAQDRIKDFQQTVDQDPYAAAVSELLNK